jgi:NAD(P)-dependent dehydrogenase (short-subunit alcohol dehydrogenase family)
VTARTAIVTGGASGIGAATLEHWQRTIAVNLTGTFVSMQAVLPDMVEAGWGRIVTISSVVGVRGSARQGHYSASKGGVIGLTKAVALEYAGRGVTANTVPPFVVDTPSFRAAQEAGEAVDERFLTRAIPAGRLGQPGDIAAVISFLCSEAAGDVTGQVVSANGGAST